MVPRKIKTDNRTITINCGTACQKVAYAGAGVWVAIVGVPTLLAAMFFYGKFLYWLLSGIIGTGCEVGERYCSHNPIADLGAFFGTIITFGLCAAVIVYTAIYWKERH